MSEKHAAENEYLEGAELTDEQSGDQGADEFFTLEEDDGFEESRGPLGPKLAAAGIMLLVSVLALVLLVGGVRTFNEARANEGYENKSWVMTGSLKDVTKDLQGDNNVAIYSGSLPTVAEIDGKTYVSEVSDSLQVKAGDTVTFRGSQTGQVKADFPGTVDALLVEDGEGQLTVVRTGQQGSLVPVTEKTVASQKTQAMLKLGGAILVFGAGVGATFALIRKRRQLL